jgi:hypothetical protein
LDAVMTTPWDLTVEAVPVDAWRWGSAV